MFIYLIFIVIGILLLAYGIAELKRRLAFVNGSERSIGTVVQLKEKKDDEGTYYFPVFEIHTSRQEVMTYVHATGTSPSGWQLGQQAIFLFEPDRPETLRMLKYWPIFGTSLILLAVAVDMLLIGAGYFIWWSLRA